MFLLAHKVLQFSIEWRIYWLCIHLIFDVMIFYGLFNNLLHISMELEWGVGGVSRGFVTLIGMVLRNLYISIVLCYLIFVQQKTTQVLSSFHHAHKKPSQGLEA